MASKLVFSIDQNFLDIYTPRINVQYLQENAVTEEILTEFMQGIPTPRAIGCAPAFTTKGSLTVVALAVKSKALLIELSSNNRRQSNEKSGRQLIQDLILCNPDCMIYALDLIYIALGLYDRGMRLHHGVDIQSAVTGRSPRDPAFAIEFAMAAAKVHTQSANIRNAFLAEWDPESPKSKTYLALRAWIACYLATVADFDYIDNPAI
ncbi:hypothetical protein C8Q75DRAFT_389817 [Abortiporus biennis]|nr:hypothetical protein C8Q75DRAFT_389817 [Abortiporus biennis]